MVISQKALASSCIPHGSSVMTMICLSLFGWFHCPRLASTSPPRGKAYPPWRRSFCASVSTMCRCEPGTNHASWTPPSFPSSKYQTSLYSYSQRACRAFSNIYFFVLFISYPDSPHGTYLIFYL
jgi:hypothetical protein